MAEMRTFEGEDTFGVVVPTVLGLVVFAVLDDLLSRTGFGLAVVEAGGVAVVVARGIVFVVGDGDVLRPRVIGVVVVAGVDRLVGGLSGVVGELEAEEWLLLLVEFVVLLLALLVVAVAVVGFEVVVRGVFCVLVVVVVLFADVEGLEGPEDVFALFEPFTVMVGVVRVALVVSVADVTVRRVATGELGALVLGGVAVDFGEEPFTAIVVVPRIKLGRVTLAVEVAGATCGPEKVDAIAEMVGEMEGERAILVRFADVAETLAAGEYGAAVGA